MTPQGSVVYATAQIDNIIAQLNNVKISIDLQEITNKAFASLSAQTEAIQSQLEIIKPIVDLANLNLADLPSVITFLNTLKTALLGPTVLSYANYIQQVAAMTIQIARLTAAIESAADRIGSSVTIPTVTLPTIPT